MGGTPVDGDRFELQPTRLGALALDVTLTAPQQIAASSIVEVYSSSDNVNTATLEIIKVNDTGDGDFPTATGGLSLQAHEAPVGTFNLAMVDSAGAPVAITDVNGLPLTSYTSGPIEFNAGGMTFKLSGDPTGQTANAPEVYNIDYAFGEGNNQNLLAMASLSDAKLVNQGRSTLVDLHEESITSVGSQTASARIEAGAAETLFSQASARMSNNSGVNLDEEASNLLRFQQAYSASARVISTANEIFQTLLQAVR
jgi:flagellar hook-associated protein 1